MIVVVGLYLKSPRPAVQAPPIKTNNTRELVPQHTESHTQLYLKVVGVHDGDTITGLAEDQS